MEATPFIYENIAIREACWINGKPYFSGQSIGEWLGYKQPRKAINKIIERNPHIEDSRWSVGVKLTSTDNKKYFIRVYNPIAFQLIIFESRQPKAIRYKIAVANLVWAYMTGNLKPSKWSQQGGLVAAARQILSLPQGRTRGELVRELAAREGVSLPTAYRRIERSTGERLKTTKGCPIHRRDRGATHYPEEKRQVLSYIKDHPTAQGTAIRRALGLRVSVSRINVWLRQQRNQT